jgi:ketosteroid isomerase-like protein
VADGGAVVERYLAAIASHRWDVVGECIADDIVRVGPYGDRFAGRDDYLAYLVDTMPKLAGYAMAVHRVTSVSEALAFAELVETVELDGKPMLTDEVLVFAFDDHGRIARVDIFIQTPRPLPSPPLAGR